jgi:membrane-associated phospholipid phosphatase
MTRLAAAAIPGLLIALAVPCGAQRGTALGAAAQPGDSASGGGRAVPIWAWQMAASGLAAVADQRISAFASSHQRATLDRAADIVDPLGRAGVLVPALAAAVVVPRLAGRRDLSDAALRVAIAYAAADGIESVLKPLIGRHRPSDGGGPWRFHPLSNEGDWHSIPSAHTVHSMALATALSLEARTPWVSVPAYSVAALVGLQRVYTGQHWTSDVVASAVLASTVARFAERRLRRGG